MSSSIKTNEAGWERTKILQKTVLPWVLKSEMLFNKNLFYIETSQLIYNTDQLTYLRYFWAGFNISRI